MPVFYSSQPSVTTVPVIMTVISPFLVQHWLPTNSAYVVLCTRVPTPPGTSTTGGGSLTHIPMPTSFPKDPPTHNGMCCDSLHWSVVLHSEHLVSTSPLPLLSAVSTDLGHSTGVTSAVFFAGLLAGVALAGPAGALSVVCYHRKKKQAKTRGK